MASNSASKADTRWSVSARFKKKGCGARYAPTPGGPARVTNASTGYLPTPSETYPEARKRRFDAILLKAPNA